MMTPDLHITITASAETVRMIVGGVYMLIIAWAAVRLITLGITRKETL